MKDFVFLILLLTISLSALADSMLLQLPDTVGKMVEIKRERPITGEEKFFVVFGRVTDAKTNLPIQPILSFHSDTVYTFVANTDGSYEVKFPWLRPYKLRVEAAGYVSRIEKLVTGSYAMKSLEMNFQLQPIEIGTTVNLKSILFQQSTHNLLPQSNDELDLVVSFLKSNPKVEIMLLGHTDNRGNPEHNQRLSQKRVERVKSYLVSKGISAKRITGKGFGGSKPIADNSTEETRRLNRRVEFTIVKD